jgi:hypothetical protein
LLDGELVLNEPFTVSGVFEPIIGKDPPVKRTWPQLRADAVPGDWSQEMLNRSPSFFFRLKLATQQETIQETCWSYSVSYNLGRAKRIYREEVF